MRWRFPTRLVLSVLCFVAAIYFWRLGARWTANYAHPAPVRTASLTPARPAAKPAGFHLLSPSANLPTIQHSTTPPLQSPRSPREPLAYRLNNTSQSLSNLIRSDHAILLENALFDTAAGAPLNIPDNLRAHGDPGSYIVQSKGPLDDAFRALLARAGATIISYIPNNAYLVRASSAVAATLAADLQTQSILPYEPYFKLKTSLLGLAVEQTPLPSSIVLNVLVFSDARAAAISGLQSIGAQIVGEDRSPFGPVFRVRPQPDGLAAVAGLASVQEIEMVHVRKSANDMSRVSVGVASDLFTTSNYLGLTGAGITVGVSDSGVDTNHPDLAGRVFYDAPISGVDSNGHGTHVAGIIASSGGQSASVTNASSLLGPYAGTNNNFRGFAPSASIFATKADPLFGPSLSDSYLQETSALKAMILGPNTNLFICNNSWNYSDLPQYKFDTFTYDLAAASYDAAVRDALPSVTGPQPLLYVFAAGDDGGGDDNGGEGVQQSVLSPATAKNVITVGAVESPRYLTNEFGYDFQDGLTNDNWFPMTDSTNQVASYSARGNVGINIEGDFGRFKPDVVAPGSFIISTRSGQWDQNAYYNYHSTPHWPDVTLQPGQRFVGAFDLPNGPPFVATRVTVYLNNRRSPSPVDPVSPLPFPDLPIFVSESGAPLPAFDIVGTNTVTIAPPPDNNTNYLYTVVNISSQPVVFDVIADLMYIDTNNGTLEALSNLNANLPGPFYRYESGSSMAAAEASGTLALMQQFLAQNDPQHRINGSGGGLQGRSPALMKAMLINGARSLQNYDFQVNNNINYQGWGLINLPTSIPGGLAKEGQLPLNSMYLFDQDTNNALSTGQSQTFFLTVSPAARNQHLRITLAWTDPPGNPIASTKLVNDLDLVVTNLDTVGAEFTDIFFGNDIAAGNDGNQPWDTNFPPNIDRINNIENVYIPAPLGSNYSITVSGYRVNVNAVLENPDRVVQDYALVVSCTDNPLLTNAITLTLPTTTSGSGLNFLTVLTNTFPNSTNYFGQTLTRQHAGASTPLLGTNLVALPEFGDKAFLTVGITNQWQFYAITNTSGFTNARFSIIGPRELSVPRMGTDVLIDTNATRPYPNPGADTDLYLSTDPNLLNLDPVALANALKAIGREGASAIIISNAANIPYFAAVKAEDQMAAEFTFQALFSFLPFEQNNNNGTLLYWLDATPIPDGTPQRPGGFTNYLGPGDPSMLIRRVIVSNLLTHELVGDLVGALRYGGSTPSTVLINHSPLGPVVNRWFIYDDSDEGNIPGALHTGGPGSLMDFAGRQFSDMFYFSMTDNALQHVGTNKLAYVFLERQPPLTGGINVTIQPGHCVNEYVQVPRNAESMTIFAEILPNQPPGAGPVSMQVCDLATSICTSNVDVGTGNTITLNQFTIPPLIPGDTYYVRLCNEGTGPVNVFVIASFTFARNKNPTLSFTSTTVTTILDDAVTYASINVTNHGRITSMDVGVLINALRASDMAVTLVSPNGKRVLLYEDRGGSNTTTIGTSTGGLGTPITSTTPFWTNNFDDVPTGPYTPGAVFDGWHVLTNLVDVYPTMPYPWLSNNILVLENGIVSNALPTTNANGYSLSFKVTRAPWIVGMLSWWPFDLDGSDIFGGFDGLLTGGGDRTNEYAMWENGEVNQAFRGDGLWTKMLVPRAPALDVASRGGFSIEGWINPDNVGLNTNPIIGAAIMSDGFELSPQGYNYPAGTNVSGWLVVSGDVDILASGAGFIGLPDSGLQCLDLNGDQAGAISRSFGTVPGKLYMLSFAYCKNPNTLNPNFVAQATLDLTGLQTIPLSYSLPNSQTLLNWSHTSIVFTASSNVTTLQLTSQNVGNGGMYLDSFSVSPLSYPSIAQPLVEWADPIATNGATQGVQFWVNGLPGTNIPGALVANIWDTNLLPHLITTVTNSLTNAGWQHVALTYDASTFTACLYTNGIRAVAQTLDATNRPLTTGDLNFGFHPATGNNFISYAGGLDEFALYQRALSDCEVFAIYHAGTNGKYGTNVLWCPLTNSLSGASLGVQVTTSYGSAGYTFTNGLAWPTNGLSWETDTIVFTNQILGTNGLGTNLCGIILTNLDPNVALDDFILSSITTNLIDGMMHFTEDSNITIVPIKFAPYPYAATTFPPTLVFTNGFENATAMVYQVGSAILGSTNTPPQQVWWTNIGSAVTVISNADIAVPWTNCLALATGGVQTVLPTIAGTRYQLTYTVRGPAAVSWWNGDVQSLDQRAADLLGGNDGAFLDSATNLVPGFVGAHTLYFNGRGVATNDLDIFPQDNDDPASVIELGDPANLRVTNGFTIEGWIKPMFPTNGPGPIEIVCGTEMIFFRGYPDLFDCSGFGNPYWLSLEPDSLDPTLRDLHFRISDSHNSQGADVITTNAPIQVSPDGAGPGGGGWYHIAAVFDKPVTNFTFKQGTNTITIWSNAMRLYVNGACLVTNYTTISPFRDLDPSLTGGVAIGNRSRYDETQPYRGYLDELTVYGRALTDPEITAIVAAGQTGKADFTVPANQGLAELEVDLDGNQLDVAYGDNAKWTTYTVAFTALHTNSVLTLQSLLPGTLVNNITLTELPPEIAYLPEQSLDSLFGQDAFGTWSLEIWDNRSGPISATNLSQLLQWQLNFQLAPIVLPPVIDLTHGIPYTNSLTPGAVQYFIVNVPQWAYVATNALMSSVAFGTTNYAAVDVFFDTNGFPGTNGLMIGPPPLPPPPFPPVVVTNLTTNSTPYFITPGQPYYLAVTNTNSFSVTFSLEVWFDILTLTNCQPLSNYVWQAGIPRYFQYDVPTNSTPPNVPATVAIYLSGIQSNYVGFGSNLTVVLSEHLPLPDLAHYDYITFNPRTNSDVLLLVTNTTPWPIQTNTWYIGVFNNGPSNVSFNVEACYNTNYPTIILLTNTIPYRGDFVLNPAFLAPPGPPQQFFFQFSITNFVDGVLFELYNLSGNADLVLQRDYPPGMAPYSAGSFRIGPTNDQIVLRSGAQIADLRGDWFLGIYNRELTNVAYSIRATYEQGGFLRSAVPLNFNIANLPLPRGFMLIWNSVVGERYVVQSSPSLAGPWANVAVVQATTPITTYEVPRPIFSSYYWRVLQISFFNVPHPAIFFDRVVTNGVTMIRISWPDTFPNETVQYSPNIAGPWANLGTPVVHEPPRFATYDLVRPQPRYYRIVP